MVRRNPAVRLLFPALVLLALATAAVIASAEALNRSAAAGVFWSNASEEGDPLTTENDDSSPLLNGEGAFDGGFSSLDGMLRWAIGHSDPATLQMKAHDAQQLSSDELKKRQMEIKELLGDLKMRSDAQMMQTALDDLKNASLPLEEHRRVLEELLILVEPIDNANDLHKLGGLAVVIGELSNPDSEIRTTSAWILGQASQNNPVVQKLVLELGALGKLVEMLKSSYIEESVKAFYAVSALIRNNFDGQELFYAEGGHLTLQSILSNSSVDVRLLKKSVFLVADLAESHLENREREELPFFSNFFFLKSVVDLTASRDVDLQEKALLATRNLLLLRSTDAKVFKNYCELDKVLDRMAQHLQKLMVEETRREYVMDVERLRREVNQIFLEKMNEVPT